MLPLAQPPKKDERSFDDWVYRLWKRVSSTAGIAWSLIDKTGANLTDIPTRHHNDLQYIPANPIFLQESDDNEQFIIPPPQTYDFENIFVPAKNMLGNFVSHYTLQDLMDHEWSAGVVDGGLLTDNGNGTVSIAAAVSAVRINTDPHSKIMAVSTVAQLNIALTDDSVNYLYISYNSGTPLFAVTTSETVPNGLDKVVAYEIHRQGNTIHYIDRRNRTVDTVRKADSLFTGFSRFIHYDGGSTLGSSGLALTVTAGTFSRGVEPLVHSAFDTTVAGTANVNVFTLWYRNVGVWVETANQKVVSTLLYDNNAATPTLLGNNQFGVSWVYIVNDSPSELHVVMGQVEYPNLASARVATPPASVPTLIAGMGSLIGFVVYEKGVVVFDNVYSAFSSAFSASAATTHNGLAGLQGGTIGEYYHLTAAEYVALGVNNSLMIMVQDGEDGADGFPIQGPIGLTGTGVAGPQGMIGIGLDGSDGEDAYPIPGPQGPQGASGGAGSTWPIIKESVGVGEACTITAGYQLIVAQKFTNSGTISNSGRLYII